MKDVHIIFFKCDALHAAWAEHFDLDLGDQSRLLWSHLPIVIYASDHIIWGRPGREFLDMKIIRYFDNLKPLKGSSCDMLVKRWVCAVVSFWVLKRLS